MKKILILCADFPPSPSAGAQRPYAWYKYLSENGVYPIIFCHEHDGEKIVEDLDLGRIIYCRKQRLGFFNGNNKLSLGLRKIETLIKNIFQFISFRFDEHQSIYHDARTFLQRENVDLIVSTGGPQILYRHAALLSREFSIKWIADYRDLWTFYPKHSSNVVKEFFHKMKHRYFELKYLKTASAITCVTSALKSELSKVFNIPIYTIRNGFIKSDQYISPVNIEDNKIKIAYLGTVYDYYNFRGFNEGLRLFSELNPNIDVEIHFFGIKERKNQRRVVERNIVSKKVNLFFYASIPNDSLYNHLGTFELLLAFGISDGPFISVKLFDYLQLKRQILLFAKNNPIQSEIVEKTNSGQALGDRNALSNFLNNYVQKRRVLGYDYPQQINLNKYNRKYQTKEFSNILVRIINESQ